MEVKEQVRQVFIDLLKIKPQELRDDVRLYEGIGLDSTEMVEIVIALEKKFGLKLGTSNVTKFSTINDIENLIKSKAR